MSTSLPTVPYRYSYSVPERRFDTLERSASPKPWDTHAPKLSDWSVGADGSWSGTRADFCVYFLQEGDDGPVKIGRTSLGLLASRVAGMQIGNSRPLHVRRVVVGGSALERVIHERLVEHRIRGEWFQPHPEVLGLLARGEGSVHPRSLELPLSERQRENAEKRAQAAAMARDGLSTERIAIDFGVSDRTIRRWLRGT